MWVTLVVGFVSLLIGGAIAWGTSWWVSDRAWRRDRKADAMEAFWSLCAALQDVIEEREYRYPQTDQPYFYTRPREVPIKAALVGLYAPGRPWEIAREISSLMLEQEINGYPDVWSREDQQRYSELVRTFELVMRGELGLPMPDAS